LSTASPAISSDPSLLEEKARLREARRNFLLCAVFFSLSLPLQPVVFGRWDPALVLTQVAWSACFVLLGLAVGAGWLSERMASSAAGLCSLANLTLTVHLTGGVASPYFPFFHTIPLIIAMFNPRQRLPVLVAIGATLGCMLLVLTLSGAPARTFISQLITFAFVAGASTYGGFSYRRLRQAEFAAQQERLEALQRLAESERRRVHAERNRAEVERLVVVGQLAAGVAHEINNPLAYVKSNLGFLEGELLREDGRVDRDEVRQILQETTQGVMRIQQIVSDLRKFSREASEAEDECSVLDALSEARRLASVRLHSLGEVVQEVPEGLPRVRLRQRHLVQVLVNLLLNAADALEAVPERHAARIVLRARPHEGGVRLEVEDNGPGIPASALPRLFEPFFTTKPPGKGTGLGLALCREYVARAGGTLTAENRPEGGARFVLTLKPARAARPS
jgi:signal transduction histidine kinase